MKLKGRIIDAAFFCPHLCHFAAGRNPFNPATKSERSEIRSLHLQNHSEPVEESSGLAPLPQANSIRYPAKALTPKSLT